ncbi:hypothetical protein LCGC14_2453000, partial [marine sediment metagenome]
MSPETQSRYDRLQAEGLCVQCAKRPARDGKIVCVTCADKTTTRYKQRRSKGVCVDCLKVPAKTSRTLCTPCAERRAKRDNPKLAKRQAEGLCIQCGKAPGESGKTRCRPCLTRANACNAKRRAEKQAKGLCCSCGGNKRARPYRKECQECSDRGVIKHQQRRNSEFYQLSKIVHPQTLFFSPAPFSAGKQPSKQLVGMVYERHIGAHFRDQGYEIMFTPSAGDFGADIIVTKDNVKTIIQAKCGQTRAGVRAVQEAFTAQYFFDCQCAMVIT